MDTSQESKLLNDEQIEVLRKELGELVDPGHPGNELFYEFNSNESADPEKILFHALGAWRITPGFHDLLWNPAFCRSGVATSGRPGSLLA